MRRTKNRPPSHPHARRRSIGALLLVTALSGSLTLVACDRQSGDAAHTAPAEARRLVESGAVLLDVRTPEEVAEGYVRGAENIPVGDLPDRLGRVEELTGGSKDRDIVVYCRSGRRAASAKKILEDAGYKSVHNLGGLSDWPNPADIVK